MHATCARLHCARCKGVWKKVFDNAWLDKVGHVGVKRWIMLGGDFQAYGRRRCIHWGEWSEHGGRNACDMFV